MRVFQVALPIVFEIIRLKNELRRERRAAIRKKKSLRCSTRVCVCVCVSHVGLLVLEAFCSPSLRRPPALLILLRRAHTFPKAPRRSVLLLIFVLHRATQSHTHTHKRAADLSSATLSTMQESATVWQKLEPFCYNLWKYLHRQHYVFVALLIINGAVQICCVASPAPRADSFVDYNGNVLVLWWHVFAVSMAKIRVF